MSQIKIDTIRCINQQEEDYGADEVYFKVFDDTRPGAKPDYVSNYMYGLIKYED